jgi:hypothetical protein
MRTKTLQCPAFVRRGKSLARRGKNLTWRIILVLAFTALINVPIWVPSISFAVINQPDSPPTISNPHVNRDLATTGDMLFYFNYDLPYLSANVTTSMPTADNCFVFRLMSIDGSADYGYISPYPFKTQNGYNKGIAALYFTASANLTWGAPYQIRISEIPGAFALPLDFNITIPLTAYSTKVTQADNQAELATNLYNMAQPLESEFGVSLFQSSGSRQVLTTDGETYFRGAITGLQAMAPAIFLIQQVPIDTTSENWTTEQFDIYEGRFQGTWVGTEMNETSEQLTGTSDPSSFGSPSMVLFIIVVIPICLIFLIASAKVLKHIEPGLVGCCVVLIMAVCMGWIPKAIFASVYQVSSIWLGYVLFGARG